MAGFSKIYVIGREAGFRGADGVTDVQLQIWVGDGNRQWLEPHWFAAPPKAIAKVARIVPAGPDDPEALLDAAIAFLPDHFRSCPSFTEAELVLADTDVLDFDLDPENVPVAWKRLREEARPRFQKLCVMQATLEPVR
jgi:hypothetical protein